MPRSEFLALLFLMEIASVFVTASVLKRWMLPPPKFGGRYWRSLLACLASLPVTVAAILVTSVVVGYPADQSYSPGGVAGQFMVNVLVRSIFIWPFVVAWLVIKPKGLSSLAATPPPLPKATKAPVKSGPPAPVRPNKAPFFRKWKNIFGLPEVEGIEALSDQRINEIYAESKSELQAIAAKKGESIPDSVLNGLIRDLLMDEARGNYAAQLQQMSTMYSEYPIKMILCKGRTY